MVITEFNHECMDNVVGGKGKVEFKYLADKSMLGNNKVRAYNILTLKPGSSIGYHRHIGESELSYILKGSAKIKIDTSEYQAAQGNLAYCPSGHSHSIINAGQNDLEIVALVIYD